VLPKGGLARRRAREKIPREQGFLDWIAVDANSFAAQPPARPGAAHLALEPPNAVAEDLLARLSASPDVYPQKLDLNAEKVLLVRFDAAAYRAASFLDDRILGPATQGAWLPLSRVAESSKRVSRGNPVHFIFHTGHVGSTLVSRLLDETGSVLSLREPLPLRTLADAHDALGRVDSLLSAAQFDRSLALFMRLWGRGYAATQCVIVKATSSAGRLAAPILARSEDTRAIYMNVRAEPYLATLLAGQNSPVDLRGHGPGRMRRLQLRIGTPLAPLHTLSLGELAAMSWLAESWTQWEAVRELPGRAIAVDFEAFLSDVPGSMAAILGHFGLPGDPVYLSEVGRSPVLARYSKAPEFGYTPNARAEVLREARRQHRDEIRKGIAWLEERAKADRAVAEVVTGVGV